MCPSKKSDPTEFQVKLLKLLKWHSRHSRLKCLKCPLPQHKPNTQPFISSKQKNLLVLGLFNVILRKNRLLKGKTIVRTVDCWLYPINPKITSNMKKLIVIHASKSQDDYKLSIEDIVEMNSQERFLCGSITFRVDDFARNHTALKERHKLAQSEKPWVTWLTYKVFPSLERGQGVGRIQFSEYNHSIRCRVFFSNIQTISQ